MPIIAAVLTVVGAFTITKAIYKLGARQNAQLDAEIARLRYENERDKEMRDASFAAWRADLKRRYPHL